MTSTVSGAIFPAASGAPVTQTFEARRVKMTRTVTSKAEGSFMDT